MADLGGGVQRVRYALEGFRVLVYQILPKYFMFTILGSTPPHEDDAPPLGNSSPR